MSLGNNNGIDLLVSTSLNPPILKLSLFDIMEYMSGLDKTELLLAIVCRSKIAIQLDFLLGGPIQFSPYALVFNPLDDTKYIFGFREDSQEHVLLNYERIVYFDLQPDGFEVPQKWKLGLPKYCYVIVDGEQNSVASS